MGKQRMQGSNGIASVKTKTQREITKAPTQRAATQLQETLRISGNDSVSKHRSQHRRDNKSVVTKKTEKADKTNTDRRRRRRRKAEKADKTNTDRRMRKKAEKADKPAEDRRRRRKPEKALNDSTCLIINTISVHEK